MWKKIQFKDRLLGGEVGITIKVLFWLKNGGATLLIFLGLILNFYFLKIVFIFRWQQPVCVNLVGWATKNEEEASPRPDTNYNKPGFNLSIFYLSFLLGSSLFFITCMHDTCLSQSFFGILLYIHANPVNLGGLSANGKDIYSLTFS